MLKLGLFSLLLVGVLFAIPLRASDKISCVYIEEENHNLCYDHVTGEFQVLYQEYNLFDALLHSFSLELMYERQVGFWDDLERWYTKWELREVGKDPEIEKSMTLKWNAFSERKN